MKLDRDLAAKVLAAGGSVGPPVRLPGSGRAASLPDVRFLALADFCLAEGLPEPRREWRFHPTRKWRLDWAFPEQLVGMELEGVTVAGGRHQRIEGYSRDCEKYIAAQELGWQVVRLTPKQFDQGAYRAVLLKLLGEGK